MASGFHWDYRLVVASRPDLCGAGTVRGRSRDPNHLIRYIRCHIIRGIISA